MGYRKSRASEVEVEIANQNLKKVGAMVFTVRSPRPEDVFNYHQTVLDESRGKSDDKENKDKKTLFALQSGHYQLALNIITGLKSCDVDLQDDDGQWYENGQHEKWKEHIADQYPEVISAVGGHAASRISSPKVVTAVPDENFTEPSEPPSTES